MSMHEGNPNHAMDVDSSPREQQSAIPLLEAGNQDPFDKLAAEIIQDIFVLACPLINLPIPPGSYHLQERHLRHLPDSMDPMVLLSVCKRWRAIAMNYHRLWTTIFIYVSRINSDQWEDWGLSQLRDRLGRSGGHPLDIRIYSDDNNEGERDTDNWSIDEILDALKLHSERWDSVQLEFPLQAQFLEHFESLVAPSLKCLGLRPKSESGYCMDALRNQFKITWGQIADLTLDPSSLERPGDLREIVSWSFGSLTSLTFSNGPWYSENEDEPESIDLIVLPQLRNLCFLSDCAGILDMLICPSLEQLDINEGNPLEITEFLSNSACALTYIRLVHIQAPQNYSTKFFRDYGSVLQHASSATVKTMCLVELPDPIVDLLVLDSRNLFTGLKILILDLTKSFIRQSDKQLVNTQIGGLKKIKASRTHDAHLNLDGLSTSLDYFRHNLTCSIVASSTQSFIVHFAPPVTY